MELPIPVYHPMMVLADSRATKGSVGYV